MPRHAGGMVRATCCVCGEIELARGACKWNRCQSCKALGLFSQDTARAKFDFLGKDQAGYVVQQEIREGRMVRAAERACADCGEQAGHYDHRDYNFPLVVEPVCRSCNARRGPAVPRTGWLDRCLSSARVPYSSRARTTQLLATLGVPEDALRGLPGRLALTHWEQLAPAIRSAIARRSSASETHAQV